MKGYTQLTQEERYQIYILKKTGISLSEIARPLGRNKATISREIRRNRGLRGYRPKQAHIKALQRKKVKATVRIDSSLWLHIDSLLRKDWSPEQVSGWLFCQHNIRISHEWIYQYILKNKRAGGDLHTHLRCRKKRRKRFGTYDRRGQIPNRVSIDERPAIVEEQKRIGDWEADTIIGKGHKQALVSLTERRSRLSLVAKVNTKHADKITAAIKKLLKPLANSVFSITSDNGKEFAQHLEIARALNASFYFAHLC